MVLIEEIIEDFAERKQSAIGGHSVEWAAFREWEETLSNPESLLPHSSLKRFRVVQEGNANLIYADGVWDDNKPNEGENIRRVYIGDFPDSASARQYCHLLNEGKRKEALRILAIKLKERIDRDKWEEFNAYCLAEERYSERE